MSLQDENRRSKQHRNLLETVESKPQQLVTQNILLPGFSEECRRQSLAAASSDAADKDLLEFLESAVEHILDSGLDSKLEGV